MSRAPIIVRVDATKETGYERLSRAMTLAAAVQRRRRPVYFLSQLEPNSLAMSIKRGGNNWIAAQSRVGTSDDAGQLLRKIARLRPAAVLVDDADVSQDYLSEINATGVLLGRHRSRRRHPLSQQAGHQPAARPARDGYEHDGDAQLLLGTRYAMVRPEIRRQRPMRSQEPPPLAAQNGTIISSQFRVLLALGEDDRI